MKKKKHIFISYRSIEPDFALRISADLKNSGLNVWMDRLDIGIRPSQDWRRSIENALTKDMCSGVIAILSPNYLESNYCLNELARADRLGIKIFPVILTPIEDTKWPIEIERLQYVDFKEWQNEDLYKTNLLTLLDELKEKFPRQITKLPNPEIQYLTKLIAELETRMGVANYVDLEGETAKAVIRPLPPIDNETGYLVLLSNKNIGTKRQRQIQTRKISAVTQIHPSFVLAGSPGAGKTTIIRNMILELARRKLDKPRTTPTPMIMSLPQWQDNWSFEEFLRAMWPLKSNPLDLIWKGELFLCLDGLNEMGAEKISKVSELRTYISKLPKSAKLIVTCRSEDYNEDLRLGDLPIVNIKPLNEKQIIQFARSYLGKSSEKFLQQVLPNISGGEVDGKGLLQLANNPYFLTAFMIIYNSSPQEELPRNSGTLFKKLVLALWEREKHRNSTNISFDLAEKEFARLAFSMINSDMPVDITREYALLMLGDIEFLKIGQNASLLTIQNNNIRFYHQLIQEYFAAIGLSWVGISHIRLDKKPLQTSSRYLGRYNDFDIEELFSSPEYRRSGKWDQVIISLCGFAENPEDIVTRIAGIDPLLAVDCLLSGIDIPLHSVIAELGKALNNKDYSLRKAAVIALGKIGDEAALPHLVHSLNDNNEVSNLSKNTLIQLGIPAIPYLAKHLNSASDDKASASINALSSIGEPAIPILQDILENGIKASSRIRACVALGQINNDKSNSLLLSLLNSNDPDLLLVCVNGLGNIGDTSSISPLIVLLDRIPENNQKLRVAVIQALGNIGSSKAVAVLLKLIPHTSWEIHSAAMASLANISTLEALVPVKMYESLKNRKQQTKKDAIEKIRNTYGVVGLLHALRHTNKSYWEIGYSLVKLSNEDIKIIITAISDENHHVRAMVAYCIGERGDKHYEKQLIALLKDKSSFVKGIAIKSVGKMKCEKAVPELLKMLSNNHLVFSNSKERVCDNAATALLKIRKKSSLLVLKKWALQQIQGRIVSDQKTPIIVLGEIGGSDAIPRLAEILKYKDYFVRQAAESALKKIGTDEALNTIDSLAE